MNGQNRPILYHFPLSPYSMRVRLVLEEKGVDWESRVVDLVNMENYEPWYVSMNPNATVPALVRGDEVIVGSERIARRIEESFPGPRLFPGDDSARTNVELWVSRAAAFPLETLHAALSSSTLRSLEARMSGPRIKTLRAFAKRRPDLESRYQAKIDDIEKKSAMEASPISREEADAIVSSELDALASALEGSDWIAGPSYSMADVFWTVVLARLSMLGLAGAFSPARRPSIAAFWQRVRERPSFSRADVWVRMKPLVMVPYFFRLAKAIVTS
jgi:glutathione S-transferase